ncbi:MULTISPECIES: hypothetical protein [Microbacterium]|uniref:hypothetical protein n=1 Tax=Microbacterium TaxID=33882 RepID=UPI0013A56604|nr:MULTISPECIES: hypothetical protein [Microbacterium]
MLTPIANALLAIVIAWLSIAVAARLVSLIPGIRNLRMNQRTGRALLSVGWALVVLTPIVTVLSTAFAADTFVTWLVVSTPLASAAVCSLGLGLATRPRVDAKVLTPDGPSNEGWAIDALMQIRNVSRDVPSMRVNDANRDEFGAFISIADRTGSGLASAIAWLVQALFNAAPWQLHVTVLDGRSAIATVRRNGQALDEVEITLDWRNADFDQHRKLLAMAAAFTSVTMTRRYPDTLQSFAVSDWRSVGYLSIASMTRGAERRHYLALATASSIGASPSGRRQR